MNFNRTVNINFIKKIDEIYKIFIKENNDLENNTIEINLEYNFELEIPINYNPKIVIDYLDGYKLNRIKFIKLENVPVSLIVNKENDLVI